MKKLIPYIMKGAPMTTLEELYFGKLNPENTAYNNKEYKMAKEQFYRTIEFLRSDISHENREFLDQLSHEHQQMELHHGKEMFRAGFSLAMKLSAEAFASGENISLSCPFGKEKI